MPTTSTAREQWVSGYGFILATMGSAVGLGNIWRFPTTAGREGGGAFVLLFLIMVMVIGLPILIAELGLGRRGQRNVVDAFRTVKPGTRWWLTGAIGLLAGVAVLSYYSVVAGWSAAYIVRMASGELAGLEAEGLAVAFADFSGHPVWPLLVHALFMGLTISIVTLGIARGIERWAKILMPSVILILIVLMVRSLTLEGAGEGVTWFLRPDWAAMTPAGVLEAVGQVFFSFSLGMGAILTFGSYLPAETNIPRVATYIGVADVAIALIAGLAVLPAVFAFGLEPEVGPGMVFIVLPAVFNELPLGGFFGTAFFIMLTLAALTSAVSIMEVLVSYLVDKGWDRRVAAPAAGGLIFLVGIPSALAAGPLAGIEVAGRDIFDLMDFLASNILLPVGGLLLVIFVGWVWGVEQVFNELRREKVGFALGPLWMVIVRWVAPLAILAVLIGGLL